MLGTPEMEPHLIEHSRRLKESGCIKHCQVYQPSSLKSQQLENILPQSSGDYERRVFNEVGEAMTWMQVCGFPIEASDFLKNLSKTRQKNLPNMGSGE